MYTFSDKIFDPFNANCANIPIIYDSFEKIRKQCTFHSLNNVTNVIPNSSDSINMLHLNIRSIINKHDSLLNMLSQSNVKWHTISMSETWLTEHLESYYNIPGYEAFFYSRIKKVGGGTAIYIAEQLKPKQLSNPLFTTAEVVCVEFSNKARKSIICQIYRAPNSDKHIFLSELEHCLIWLKDMNSTIHITGDFNFDLFSIETSCYISDFFTTMCSYGFFPTISKTTRSSNSSNTLLDNIFSNSINKVSISGILLHDMSDHFPIFASMQHSFNIHTNDTYKTISTFNYAKLNDLKDFLAQNLANIEDETDPNIVANIITTAYNTGITKFSTSKKCSRRTTPKNLWVSQTLLISISHKSKLYEIKLNKPTPQNILTYNRYRNILTKLLKNAKKQYFNAEFDKCAGDTKKTWDVLSNLMNAKPKTDNIPETMGLFQRPQPD